MNPATPSESSDGDLVRRAQSGDRKAFGQLIERYMRRAYYSALGLVGSTEDAMDLSQEAFVRAFNARQTIDPSSPGCTRSFVASASTTPATAVRACAE